MPVPDTNLNGENTNGDFTFPDMPESVLDGRLGDICAAQLNNFPRAYAWPALLTVASALIEERTAQTNLYTALVGPVGSGKTQAAETAIHILGLSKPRLLQAWIGSGEALTRETCDAKGAARLLYPDELAHLLGKSHIENSSFMPILNSAFSKIGFTACMGKKENTTFNCWLSILGGIVEEKFDKLFDVSTTGGFYDRFLFGYHNTNFRYDYRPFSGVTHSISPTRVCVDREVWQLKSDWLKLHRDWHPRVVEIAIRAAIVCAAFSGRTSLTAEDLNPAYELVRYQTMVREVLKPNPGENFDGKIHHKITTYLNRLQKGQYIGRRELLKTTRTYQMGPANCDRVLAVMKMEGDIETVKVGKKEMLRLAVEDNNGDK